MDWEDVSVLGIVVFGLYEEEEVSMLPAREKQGNSGRTKGSAVNARSGPPVWTRPRLSDQFSMRKACASSVASVAVGKDKAVLVVRLYCEASVAATSCPAARRVATPSRMPTNAARESVNMTVIVQLMDVKRLRKAAAGSLAVLIKVNAKMVRSV